MDNNRESLAIAAKVIATVVGTLLLVGLLYYTFIFSMLAAMTV